MKAAYTLNGGMMKFSELIGRSFRMKRIFFKQNQYKEKTIMFLLLCSLIGIVSCQVSIESIEASLYENRGRNTKLDGQDGSGFITRGSAVNPPGTWPWVVSLGGISLEDGHHVHQCAGVIVSNNNILTTVGCLDHLFDTEARDQDDEIHTDKIYAKAGDDNLKVYLDDKGAQVTQLENYVIHPRYGVPDKNNYHYHDIVMLTMKTSFKFDKYVRPIDLPAINEDGEVASEENLLNEVLVFSDWGKDFRGKTMSSRSMTINPDEDCQKAYPSLASPEELLCGVEYPSISKICNVDYGTPIVRQDQEINRFVLEGFFSIDLYTLESCKGNNNPNLIVPITSRSNIQFIYKQLYQKSFPELEEEPAPKEEPPPITFPENADLIYENCGRNSLLEREPNDEKSQLKKYPWQVSIGYFNPENLKEWIHKCGGSIVTRTKIITAAHCDPSFAGIKMSVRAGDDKLQNQIDDKGVQTVEAKTFSRHPQFNLNARYFDVGVMEMKTPLKMTKFVRPICLLNIAEAKKITKEQETGLPLTTTGWGTGEDLKVIVARVLTEEKCNKTHEDKSVNKNSVPNLFSSDLLCASDPTGDDGVCNGDSGGPAAYLDQTEKRYYLRAIVSGSALSICGAKLFPNIYVRTADISILSWILEHIKQKPQKVLIEGKTVINQNQPIQYNCSADSYPVSDISWIVRDKDGNEIPSKSNGNSLVISSVEASDNLLVTCVAHNFMGRDKATKRGMDDVIGKYEDSTALIMSGVFVPLIVFIIAIVVILLYFKRNGGLNNTSCCAQPCGKKKFPSDTSLEVIVHDQPSAPLLPTTKINWKSETQKLAMVSHGGAGTWGVNDQGDIFQRSGKGNWKKVEGPKLMDISVGYKEIWGVDGSNQIYKFKLINQHARTPWEKEGEDFIQVSVSPLNTNNPDVWACDKDYKILHRQSEGEWLPIKTEAKVKMVTVGEAGVWIINDEDDVYYREGTYQKIENNTGAPTLMVSTGWNKVSDDKKFMWLSSGEGIVWGINTKDELLYRDGISENAKSKVGTKWVPVEGVNGNFKQIDVYGKSLWGVNANDKVYYSE